jgi:hypothetical protein
MFWILFSLLFWFAVTVDFLVHVYRSPPFDAVELLERLGFTVIGIASLAGNITVFVLWLVAR